MTERELSNLDLWMWEYPDNRKNYPGIHLTGRPAACDALKEWLVRLRDTPGGGTRTIPLLALKPEDIAKISGTLRYRGFSKLELTVTPERDDLQQMSIRQEGERVILEITSMGIGELLRGIQDVRTGTGDYSIRPQADRAVGHKLGRLDRESLCLWFWPCIGHLAVT